MSKSLDDLCADVRFKAEDLIRMAISEYGFNPVVVDTMRTEQEQAQNVKQGTSKTVKSLHLKQPCCGKSHAIDIAPRHLMKMKNWAPKHPDWEKLGLLGERIGLQWGGRWKRFRDCPHFYKEGKCSP